VPADLAYRANAAMYKSLWGYLARTSYTPPSADVSPRTRDLLWRPDHAHHIDTLSYCNMIRRVLTIGRESGRWPVALMNDAAFYAGNDPYHNAPRGMTLGPKGGQWKPERIAFTAIVRPHIGEPTFFRHYRKNATELD
jgi:hypothetical protein